MVNHPLGKHRSSLLVWFLSFFIIGSALGDVVFPKHIQGTWVAEGSVYSNQIREVRDADFGFNYLQYRFEPKRFCTSYNPYETFRCFGNLKLSGDTLWVMGSPMYLMKRKSDDLMDLIRINGGIVQRLQRLTIPHAVYRPDSIYLAQPGLNPTHQTIFSSLFFFNSLVIYPAPREDQIISLEMTITASGQVRDVQVLSDHSRLRRRWFLRSMLDSSGEWIPAEVDGRPVSCRIKIELIRVGYKTLEAEEKAWRYYNAALRYITKNNYKNALISLNDALVYSPGNPRLLFTRAACHFYLKDEKRQCEDVLKARESCPFIPTAMADEELGILVECFKRQ